MNLPIASHERARAKDLLRRMTPTEFESHVAQLLTEQGLTDVQHVGGAGDLAADITCIDPHTSELVVVQCKRYGPDRKVGSLAMQHFIGMVTIHHKAKRGIFVATSGYTRAALDLAGEHHIRLVDGEEVADWLIESTKRASGEHLEQWRKVWHQQALQMREVHERVEQARQHEEEHRERELQHQIDQLWDLFQDAQRRQQWLQVRLTPLQQTSQHSLRTERWPLAPRIAYLERRIQELERQIEQWHQQLDQLPPTITRRVVDCLEHRMEFLQQQDHRTIAR